MVMMCANAALGGALRCKAERCTHSLQAEEGRKEAEWLYLVPGAAAAAAAAAGEQEDLGLPLRNDLGLPLTLDLVVKFRKLRRC